MIALTGKHHKTIIKDKDNHYILWMERKSI